MMARAPWERGLPGDNEPKKPVELSKSLDKADYIWNVEWQTEMDSMKKKEEAAAKPKVESGFLNLGRSGAMDSMELDLSDERLQRTKSDVEEAAEKVASPFQSGGPEKYPLEAAGWKYVPTRAEKKNWDKGQAMKSQKQDSSQYSSLSAGDQTAVASEEDAEEKARKLEQSRAEYSELQASSPPWRLYDSHFFLNSACADRNQLSSCHVQPEGRSICSSWCF
ncbi:hypothetical protein CYMTET_20333 [Cymbomonas tetramitiformis]|uniref:Uncharacterized protein n=1 Tax=Cymbomonas tetramitiformis TaxID=36881 RepID=A0AAE0L4B7_9CHLO|nr:hypothetical protein CYMTET_20333 [Cymbomonas tetramitiformis]